MKCPICGCKMRHQIACPYCKITGEEVKFASNKEAKRRIKNKDTKEVYVSTYIPYDVNKKVLLPVTIFGGFFGVDAFILGRYKRALIQSAIILVSFLIFIMNQYIGFTFLRGILEFMTLVCAVFVVMWLSSIFNIIFFNKATVPVVLPNKEQLKDRLAEQKEKDEAKKQRREQKDKQNYEKALEKQRQKQEKKALKKDKNNKE